MFYSYFFCREVILFAARLFFLPKGFSFCSEVFLFALRLILFLWQSAGPPYLKFSSRRFFIFFNMWVFMRTGMNFAHLVSFHYSSHRIRGLARSENAGHFCMSDKWKQSFQNAAFYNCCSSVVRGEKREHDLISSPVSTLSLGVLSTMTAVTTWEEMKVQVRRIHWEITLKDDK